MERLGLVMVASCGVLFLFNRCFFPMSWNLISKSLLSIEPYRTGSKSWTTNPPQTI